MKIITRNARASGSRPPIQTWDEQYLPDEYVWCPEEFEAVFYSENPGGFVNIEIENDTVTAMSVNYEALEAYRAAHPAKEKEPTADDVLNALLGVM